MSIKDLDLDGGDWIGDDVINAIQKSAAETFRYILADMASRAMADISCDGIIHILLNINGDFKGDDFVNVDFDSADMIIRLNVIDAIKKRIQYINEDYKEEEIDKLEMQKQKSDLLFLAEKIRELADRLPT